MSDLEARLSFGHGVGLFLLIKPFRSFIMPYKHPSAIIKYNSEKQLSTLIHDTDPMSTLFQNNFHSLGFFLQFL